jgi:Glycoside hydrolase family 44
MTATIGSQVQFVATVSGTGSYSSVVTWSIAGPAGSTLSTGTLSSTGLYTTPYPAPPTVIVTATSTEDPTVSGSATVTLSPPATAAGPAVTVDASQQTRAISPYIYGMDAYLLNATPADVEAVAKTNITVDRWGGDSTERYNYQFDVTNSIADYFFENQTGNGGDGWQSVNGVSAFDNLVQTNNADGIVTLGTVPVLGWVSKDSTSCSFPVSTYPDQEKVDTSRECGNGIYAQGVNGCTNASGCEIVGNDPTVTSINEPPPAPPLPTAVNATWASGTWAGGWVAYLANKFGPGNPGGSAGKGVAIYDLDNEPSWWDSNDFDVHPDPFTYDEVTNGGIGTALAIKTADPTAQVSGPVMDFWWDYFYSKKDVESGWSSGPCYQPWSNPIDRTAHNGTPFIQYYLQQFATAETTYGMRLLDYVDLHTYYAASYNGNSVAFTTAGDTGMQQARLNSTRAFWDPTYTDPSIIQPNYVTDSNYTSSCTVPPQSPQLIPMMKSWVNDPKFGYPGTKLAIDEYNWGGMESINGALAQADILGIFGAYGLDLGTMWPTSDPSGQIPGMMAFAMYRNYDGNKSTFGDIALASTSANQGQLAVYGALRNSDNAVTIMVINKTYGDLTETLNLANVSSTGTAQSYLYSNANLAAIAGPVSIAVTPPASGGTTSALSTTFPAQSITLLVVPQT